MIKNSSIFLVLLAIILFLSCDLPKDENSDCYSPTQNLDIAYEKDSVGCTCNKSSDEAVCIKGVALECGEDGRWLAVEDEACMPVPPM